MDNAKSKDLSTPQPLPDKKPLRKRISDAISLRERVKELARKLDIELAEDAAGAVVTTVGLKYPNTSDPEDPLFVQSLAKSELWKDVDPFPDIAPSLLNSADIDDYMTAAAMVFPYDEAKRKTASYPLSVGNEIAFWDPKSPDTAPIKILEPRSEVVIPSNSLIYVRTAESFQLPNYIAVRFNLHIDLVHKGLLLGTGPLVDPGFSGKLMVPLHNLTSNNYVLQVGEDFIWAEFTKTSMVSKWTEDSEERPARSGSIVQFEKRKINKSFAEYLLGAQRGHKILQPGLSHKTLQNAIPDAIERTRQTAMKAKNSARKAKDRAKRIQITVTSLGVIALLGALATLYSQYETGRTALRTTVALVDKTNDTVHQQADRIRELELSINQLKRRIETQERKRLESGTSNTN